VYVRERESKKGGEGGRERERERKLEIKKKERDEGSISPTFSRAFFARVFCTNAFFSSYVQKRARKCW